MTDRATVIGGVWPSVARDMLEYRNPQNSVTVVTYESVSEERKNLRRSSRRRRRDLAFTPARARAGDASLRGISQFRRKMSNYDTVDESTSELNYDITRAYVCMSCAKF